MWWIIGIIGLLYILVKVILPEKKGDPDCKICEGKGEIWWPGFDGMGDYWYDCKCTKKDE